MGVDEKSLYLLFNFVVNLKLPLKIKSIKNNNKKIEASLMTQW